MTTMSGNANLSSKGSHHRRAHSEVNFRLPDLDLFEEIGSDDDLFSTYIDIEKFGSRIEDCRIDDDSGADGVSCVDPNGGASYPRHRHWHSNSVDGSSMSRADGLFGDLMETKKAMAPDKLAELWALDPKRAKRILANRQSASRSKERKAHYISELERKVQTLQTEATTLSAQLTLFQSDTTGLTTENTELKLRLQAVEQQAQLRDVLNEVLKQEVERLKIATGEIMSPGETFNLGMHIPYTPSSFFSLPQQQWPGGHQNIQSLQFHPSQCSIAAPAHSRALSDMFQLDPLSQLQGLNIGSSRALHFMKSEGSSISASENSSTI